MADKVTKLADIVVPAVWAAYIRRQILEKSTIITSGIVRHDPKLDQIVRGGGSVLDMPAWNALDGEDQVFDFDTKIETDKITAHVERAVVLTRAKAWAAHQLSAFFAGDKPMEAIGAQVGQWWTLREQVILLNVLKGVFDSPSMSDLILTAATPLDADMVLDSKQLLGDRDSNLTAIMVNSAVYTSLQKQGLIELLPDVKGHPALPTYLGYRVIYNDLLAKDGDGNHVSYMFGEGAISRSRVAPYGVTEVSTKYDDDYSTEKLYNRTALVMHVNGMSWVNPNDARPSNADLANGAFYNRVVEKKDMRLVKIVHK